MPRNFVTGAFDFKAARKLRGVSQLQAAELLHTTQPSISRWEADGTMPNIYRMAWNLYWKLEDLNDSGPNKRARKSGTSKRKIESSKSGADRGDAGSCDSSAASSQVSS